MSKKSTMLKSSCPVDADSTNPNALFQSTNAKHSKCYQIRAINAPFVNILTMAHQILRWISFFLKATRTHAWQSPKLHRQSDSRPNECARHGRGPIQAKASAHQSVSLPTTPAPTHHDASNCKRDKYVVASVAKPQQELQNWSSPGVSQAKAPTWEPNQTRTRSTSQNCIALNKIVHWQCC